MEKQLFAKIGVFALLGLNVGAYYVFWPHQNGGAKSEAKAQPEEKGEVKLMPAKPKELPPKSVDDAVPLSLSTPPKLPETKSGTDDELVEKLLSRIKEQTQDAKDKPPVTLVQPTEPKPFDEKNLLPPPKPPLFPDAGKPGTLPDLDGKPLKVENVGVTSPLTPKTPPSVWTLHTEPGRDGGQTNVTAEIHGVKFYIRCKQFDTKPGGNEAIAVGNVSFDGEAIRGMVRCNRLTLRLGEPRVVFDEQVIFIPSSGSGRIRSDRLIWENLPGILPIGNVKPSALGSPK